jgi:hypothetical protein
MASHRRVAAGRRIVDIWCSAAVAAVLLVAGCSDSDGGPASTVTLEGAERFPGQSVRDWKSYADHVAVYTVTSEREIPAEADEGARGEGLVGREVTLRIDRMLWSAPEAPPLPAEIKMTAPGWVLVEGERSPVAMHDATRVSVGGRYLAPVVRVEDGPAPEWWPLTIGSQIPLEGERLAAAPADPAGNSPRDELAGRSVDEARTIVARERPDPIAARHRDVRPTQRLEAVQDEAGPS